MKKILKFLKTMLLGVISACVGMCVAFDIQTCIAAVKAINTGSGWTVLFSFFLLVVHAAVALIFIYELGAAELNSLEWSAYKKNHPEHNNDSSTAENETSDEAANNPDGNSQEPKKRSKKK